MGVTEEKDGALATAAAAAAAGAAVYGLKKALASGGNGKSSSSGHDDDYDDDSEDGEESKSGKLSLGSGGGGFLQSVWESASDSLVPLAEEAADAAGKWVAENSPDLIREHIVPRFIESFQDAA